MADLVDIVVNVYERTYREVLTIGWFPALTASIGYRFARRVVLINNTDDPLRARALADELLAAGEIDEAHFVADKIDDALVQVGLARRDLEPSPHFSDCAYVALALEGSPWLVYWDADLAQSEPNDWVTPGLRVLRGDPTVAVVNPSWHEELPQLEAHHVDREFAFSYGFSDWVFLGERARFLEQRWTGPMMPATYRFPLAHITPVFEQRTESWMRRTGSLRATYLAARVEHKAEQGANYPDESRLAHRVRQRFQRLALALGPRFFPRDPRFTPHPKV